jgi:hypothetical protein
MAASDELRVAMERGAARLKELVLKQPPLDLLTYLWSQLQMGAMLKSDDAHVAGVLPNDGEASVHSHLSTPTRSSADDRVVGVVPARIPNVGTGRMVRRIAEGLP